MSERVEATEIEKLNVMIRQGWTLTKVEFRPVYLLEKPQDKASPGHAEKTEQSKTLPTSSQRQGLFSLKLDAPVREDEKPFSSFFVNRVLSGFKEKHSGFSYELKKDNSGSIVEITVVNIAEAQHEELKGALAWSVKRVLENRKK
ncbi:MAG: hypothetical protein ACRECH_15365 [Nitrososphaerales archaeon]